MTDPAAGPSRYGASRWDAGREPVVGARVVVRRHLRDGESSHLFTDLIGHVEELGPVVRLRRGNGEVVSIPAPDIAVLKVLPARPVRTRDIRAWEYSCALGWPGTEAELVDGWLCRAGDNWSYRLPSAVPVLPWASTEQLDGVRDWYASRGLPLSLVVVDRLVDIGRMLLGGTLVAPERLETGRDLHLCTAAVDQLAAAATAADRDRVRIVDEPAVDWLSLYHGTAGLDPDLVRPTLLSGAATREGEIVPGGRVGFARLEIGGELAAITRGVVTAGPDGVPRLGISCVETNPDFRRRGSAEVVTAAVAGWGRQLGARECYLHVFADNAAGGALWSKLGFTPHHGLRHVRVDSGDDPLRSYRPD